MIIIDKVVGNFRDKYSSKCLIRNYTFHFDTIENNLEFAYFCLKYHMEYLKEIYTNKSESDDQVVKIGKTFGFHYHINERDEWYYLEVSIINDSDFDLDDFLNNNIKYRIGINPTSANKVTDTEDIKILNSGFQNPENIIMK